MKPREFALKVRPWETQAFSWDEANPNALVTGETIHVREVLPATECAEAERIEKLIALSRQAEGATELVRGQLDACRIERDELATQLADTMALAHAAMAAANRDGASYDIERELADAIALLAKAKGRAE